MLLIWALVLLHVVVGEARVRGGQEPCYDPRQSAEELEREFEAGEPEVTEDTGRDELDQLVQMPRIYTKSKLEQLRRMYTKSKLDIDLSVIGEFASREEVPSRPGQPQVAFLFLTISKLYFEEVWRRFFKGAGPGRTFRIYVHRAMRWHLDEVPLKAVPLKEYGAEEVKPVETNWCALMGVEVALLAAALEDPFNQQFVFLAHDAVPLKKFDYVYQHLAINSPKTSKFCFADKAIFRYAMTETVRNELLRECVFRDFYRDYNPRTLKHHQWVVLSRSHAQTVLRWSEEALRLWNASWQKAAPDLTYRAEGCSDEAVPVTALLHSLEDKGASTGNTWADFARLGVEQQCLTFVLWRHCFGSTELHQGESFVGELGVLWKHKEIRMLTSKDFDFFQSPLKRELNGYPAVFKRLRKDYLSKLGSEGFMFARKFVHNITVEDGGRGEPLAEALESLWDNIDEGEASQKIWQRLSSEGIPRPL